MFSEPERLRVTAGRPCYNHVIGNHCLYTIYFHLQHIGPTASEKDNMVISFLTLNNLHKNSLINRCLFNYRWLLFSVYHTLYSGLYSTTTSQPNILLYYWYSSSLYTIPYIWTMCAVLLFTWHYCPQLFFLIILCYCLCAYYFTCCLFMYGLFIFFGIVCLTFYVSVYSCDGVRLSHWIKGYLTWLDI